MAIVLTYDLGGTKLAAAAVNDSGQILKISKQLANIHLGPEMVIKQMGEMGKNLCKDFPEIKIASVASAGPLDPRRGLLLDPTNFISNGKSWGVVDLAGSLAKELGLKVIVDNDAAAAAVAEHWVGAGQEIENLIVMTLGTGVGIGVIANGQLLRSGRYLHPEASHIPICFGDSAAPCGCGLKGCIEAYLGASNFIQRLRDEWNEASLTGEDLLMRARNHESKSLKAFEQYSEWMAVSIHSLVVLFSPQKILIGGGFGAALPLFLPKTKVYLNEMLKRRKVGVDLMPIIQACQFGNEAGLIGAAKLALV